ncbi:MAG: hypothetical protein QXG67_02725 [Candidatus Nitrosotenuis sp.]
MNKFIAITGIVILTTGFYSAYAHVDVFVDPYDIEVGWREEPPLVNQQNAITYKIMKDGSGVTNAFRDMTATVKSGSVSKQLEILSDVRTGHYYSKIIPTQMGPITVELRGTIAGVPINEQITIEDVEDINLLAFPPTGASQLPDLVHLKNAMSSLQKDIAQIKSSGVDGSQTDVGKSYDYAVFALGIGAAGVVLAVVSLIKRK